MATHEFKGVVVDKVFPGAFAGMRVEALDVRQRLTRAVASAAVSPRGEFTLRVSDEDLARIFGDATPVLFLRVVTPTGYLASTSKTQRWDATRDASGRIEVDSGGAKGTVSTTARRYVLEGVVVDASGPVVDAVILVERLFIKTTPPKTLDSKQVEMFPPEEVVTDALGRFKVTYDPVDAAPDLEITATVEASSFSASLRVLGAAPYAHVTVTHDKGDDEWGPLYAKVVKKIAESGEAPTALRSESAQSRQHIATRSDQPLERITRLADANRLANGASITDGEEVFFGLLSQGEPADEIDLYARGLPQLRRSLEAAIGARQVKAFSAGDVDTRISQLAARGAVALDTAAGGRLPIGALIKGATDVAETPRRTFTSLLLAHDGSLDTLWPAVVTAIGEVPAAKIRFTTETSALVGAHLPLLAKLNTMRSAPGSMITDAESLAKLSPEEIDAAIDSVVGPTFPVGMPNVAAYKAAVKKNIESAFRMTWMRARVADDPIGAHVATFFSENPTFSFFEHRIATFPGVASEAIPELKKVERLVHVASSHTQVKKALAAGFGSANEIHGAGLDKIQAVLTTGSDAIDLSSATELYESSCWKVTAANAALLSYGAGLSRGLASTPGYQLPTSVPDWETLFGSLDACACAHCQSVYGPNAYLVDLLQFLGKQVDGTHGDARARLLSRRPDLQRLRLDCDTATTPLPQIDLVNEVLELLVAEPTQSSWPTDTVFTSSTTLELAARPEIKYPEHYATTYGQILREAKYPFNLPFDLWVEEARVVLEHLGVRRSRLIEVFGPTASRDEWMWTEELGLNASMTAILFENAAPPGTDHTYWGMGALNFPEALQNVEGLMDRTGLSFAEVQTLSRIEWPGGAIEIDVPQGAECDAAEMEITGLTVEALWDLQRLLRFKVALGYSLEDTAKILLACAGSAFQLDPASPTGAEAFALLGTIHELVREWKIGVPEAIAFLLPMDCDGGHSPSLFARVFLEKRLHPIAPPPVLVSVEHDGSALTGLVSLAPILTAALRVDARELSLMIDPLSAFAELGLPPVLEPTTDPEAPEVDYAVDLKNLSRLYRLTRFARETGTSLRELLVVRSLTENEPLADVTSAKDFRAFLRRVIDVREGGLTTDEVLYIVRNVITPTSSFGLDDTAAAALYSTIESTIFAALHEADAIIDPEGQTTARLLDALVPGETTIFLQLLRGGTPTIPGGLSPKLFLKQRLGYLLESLEDANTQLLVTPEGGVTDALIELRFTYLVRRLARFDLIRRAVIDRLASTFSLDVAVVAFLVESGVLTTHTSPNLPLLHAFLPKAEDSDLQDPTIPLVQPPAMFDLLRRFDKVALLVRRTGLTERALRTLYPDASIASGGLLSLDLDALSNLAPSIETAGELSEARPLFAKLVRLMNLARLRDRLPRANDLFDMMDAATAPGATEDALHDMITRVTTWNRKDVVVLCQTFGIGVSELQSELSYLRLEEAFLLLRRLGVSARDAIDWTDITAEPPANAGEIEEPSAESSLGIAQSVTQAARAKYDEDGWTAVAQPIRDALRKKQRDALVSHLCAGNLTPDDLFKELYLDVQIGPIQRTSRAVAAAGSIQTFVQRALLGLDGQISEAGAREWQWMKSYRVWEANRKVFLYPENYIDPMLRTDKSPLFKKLEQDLRQGELTFAAAESAYRNYLDGLAEVANLEVLAVYDEIVEKGPFSIYDKNATVTHVLGRTGEPHKYFHRMRRRGRWTPWERVDIEANSDHFVFAAHGGRLYLMWLISERRAIEGFTYPENFTGAVLMETRFGIAYATRSANGAWSRATAQPRDAWGANYYPSEFLVLSALSASGQLRVRVTGKDPAESGPQQETLLILDPCTHLFAASSISLIPQWKPEMKPYKQRWLGTSPGVWIHLGSESGSRPLMASSPTQGRATASGGKFSGVHYVYRDVQRSFFIEKKKNPSLVTDIVPFISQVGSNLNQADPIYDKATASAFYHPYCCAFQSQLNAHGLDGLLSWSTQGTTKLQLAKKPLASIYNPTSLFSGPFPVEQVEFHDEGAYSLYNWELFFHAPLQIAMTLMSEQRFDEAQRWFHYIFDPTDASPASDPRRFWKVKPFYENVDIATIAEELLSLAEVEWTEAHYDLNDWLGLSPTVQKNAQRLAEQITAWRSEPFDPHGIARRRPLAYQKLVVMKYVENLVAWGDYLFTQDTIESTNEATQLYLFALELLGKRPVTVDGHGETEGKSYAELGSSIDPFSNALEVEVLAPAASDEHACGEGPMIPELWTHLYFCIPQNDTLIGMWSVVEDRLFKLRNSLNIEGIARSLPLFAPPIDPALLVRAAAAGVDIGSVLNDRAVSAGPYRFTTYLAKAIELAQVVTSYGQSLLAALEKRDAEELQNLRASQETTMQETVLLARRAQIEAAKQEVAAAQQARKPIEQRLEFYKNVDFISVTEGVAMGTNVTAGILTLVGQGLRLAASAAGFTPDWAIGAAGWAASPVLLAKYGGSSLSKGTSEIASAVENLAGGARIVGDVLTTVAAYDRRWDEWKREEKALAQEALLVDKQIVAAQLRQAVAEAELATVEKQVAHAKEIADRMVRKLTNQELYEWMKTGLSELYFQSYNMAFDMAKRAERAFQNERGDDSQTFVRFGYWDGMRKGLLAGERLLESLRRMDAAYCEQNRRELEITKHVALSRHAPEQLLELRENGKATFSLTEADFDQDFPTHYLRRIKTASVSLHCTTGPYDSVKGTLSLLKGETRKKAAGDDGPVSHFTQIQSIVTSEGREDAGLFEVVLRDERLLPFEGVGAHVDVGDQWKFELTKGNELDYASISDLVLHLRYTAREGRDNEWVAPEARKRMFSLRHDFPDGWFAFMEGGEAIDVRLAKSLFPVTRSEDPEEIKAIWFIPKWVKDQEPEGPNKVRAALVGTVLYDISDVYNPTGDPADPTDVGKPGGPGPTVGGLISYGSADIDRAFGEQEDLYRLAPAGREHLIDVWVIVTYA